MNWPQFAKRLLLSDRRLHEPEVALLRRAVLRDGVVDQEEIEFLVDLKREAEGVPPSFDDFFYEVVRRGVLKDGTIGDDEARWLRKVISADGKLVAAEAKLVERLWKESRTYGLEFTRLYQECCELNPPPRHR
jgi:hypothetical protein